MTSTVPAPVPGLVSGGPAVTAVEGSAQAARLADRPDLAALTVVTSAHPGGAPDSAHTVGSCPYTPGAGPDEVVARDVLAAAGWSLAGPWVDSGGDVYIAAVRRDLPAR